MTTYPVEYLLCCSYLFRYCDIPPGEVEEWVNAIGLILTWLPEPYWIVIHDRIIDLLQVSYVN